ncbi:MAG: cob(I)yrinic acid a,c-diamide adenosyltransferase [Burkholderiaceae bacterium]|jgi:cob(I)alamin adenosyltransferase
MGLRLSKITTRTGDDGTTGLGDGTRVAKTALRVHAMGDVDELNSTLGLLLCETLPGDVTEALIGIQHDLFDLGGTLCIPGFDSLTAAQVARLDGWLAQYNGHLPPLAEFILPGGSRPAALAHVARTVCRRAERSVVALAAAESVPPTVQNYLNRLSDLLFVLARVLNNGNDVLWRGSVAPV